MTWQAQYAALQKLREQYVAPKQPGAWYAYGDYEEWVSDAARARDRAPRPQDGRMPLCYRCIALGHAQPVDQTVITLPVYQLATFTDTGRTISFCKACVYKLQLQGRPFWRPIQQVFGA